GGPQLPGPAGHLPGPRRPGLPGARTHGGGLVRLPGGIPPPTGDADCALASRAPAGRGSHRYSAVLHRPTRVVGGAAPARILPGVGGAAGDAVPQPHSAPGSDPPTDGTGGRTGPLPIAP